MAIVYDFTPHCRAVLQQIRAAYSRQQLAPLFQALRAIAANPLLPGSGLSHQDPAHPKDRLYRVPSALFSRVCEIDGCWVNSASMIMCPYCHHPATKRDGYDGSGRQRYHCRPCHRDFTAHSASAFSGYRWPADVILMAVRWYSSLPLSAAQVVGLLAERNIDVSARTVLKWVQTFGPQLAAVARPYRYRLRKCWWVDEVFCFRGKQKLYLYRAVDAAGQVVDVLLRDKRDRASAEAFFRRAFTRTGVVPTQVITDHHQPYIKAVGNTVPTARHVRTGLHRARGETTQRVERSHVPTRDRLRCARGLRTVHTGQRFVESFEGLHALRRGHIKLHELVPGYRPRRASVHEMTRAVVTALNVLGARLKKAA